MNMKSRLERAEQHVVDDGFVFAAFELVDRGGKRRVSAIPPTSKTLATSTRTTVLSMAMRSTAMRSTAVCA